MENIVIVGYGGFAKEVKFLIDRINRENPAYSFLGFVDKKIGTGIIGDDDFLISCKDKLNVAIAIGDQKIRKALSEKYSSNANIIFPNLIDPSVIYSDDLNIGKGNIICANTVITIDVKIGDFCHVNLANTIGHGTLLKDFVTVNPGCNISGDVTIGRNSNIGTGTKIIQGLTLGDRTITGAGTVVVKNIEGDCTVVGAPARVIK